MHTVISTEEHEQVYIFCFRIMLLPEHLRTRIVQMLTFLQSIDVAKISIASERNFCASIKIMRSQSALAWSPFDVLYCTGVDNELVHEFREVLHLLRWVRYEVHMYPERLYVSPKRMLCSHCKRVLDTPEVVRVGNVRAVRCTYHDCVLQEKWKKILCSDASEKQNVTTRHIIARATRSIK